MLVQVLIVLAVGMLSSLGLTAKLLLLSLLLLTLRLLLQLQLRRTLLPLTSLLLRALLLLLLPYYSSETLRLPHTSTFLQNKLKHFYFTSRRFLHREYWW